MEQAEYKNFSNKYLDEINTNYMLPVFYKLAEHHRVGSKILDVGCGNGLFGSYFKNDKSYIAGVDASEYALKGASERGYDQVSLIQDFCTSVLPFEDESFDFVICKDVLEHLLDPVFLLKEINRVVKKNGHAFINVPNHFPIVYRLKFLITGNIDTQNFFSDSKEWNFPHIRFFTHKGIIELCESENFKLIESFSGSFPSYIPKTHMVYPLKKIQDYWAQKFPSQFALAFPLLLKKL